MQKSLPISIISFALVAIFMVLNNSCTVSYGLNEKVSSIPDSTKTIKVNFIENRAPYINPQLSPTLTDRVKQRITSQTKLTNVSGDNAHWELSGSITDYSVITTGVASQNGNQQATINRLTVSVHITLNKVQQNKIEEFDVSRSFDFSASTTLQAAEAALLDDMVRNLTDEIFNKLFSDW
jgi:hypothetical protein